MSDLTGISSISAATKTFRLTSQTEVSMEMISPTSLNKAAILETKSKIEEGLALSFEIRNRLEAQLSYFSVKEA